MTDSPTPNDGQQSTSQMDLAITVIDAYRNVTGTVAGLLSGGADAVGKAFVWTGYAVSFTATYSQNIKNNMSASDAFADANFKASLSAIGSYMGAIAGGALVGGTEGAKVAAGLAPLTGPAAPVTTGVMVGTGIVVGAVVGGVLADTYGGDASDWAHDLSLSIGDSVREFFDPNIALDTEYIMDRLSNSCIADNSPWDGFTSQIAQAIENPLMSNEIKLGIDSRSVEIAASTPIIASSDVAIFTDVLSGNRYILNDDGTSAVIVTDNQNGVVSISTTGALGANGQYVSGQYKILSPSIPIFTPDGKISFTSGDFTLLADPASGTATITSGGTTLVTQPGTSVTASDVESGYAQVSVGGATMTFGAGTDSILSLGDAVVTAGAGSQISEVWGGGFVIIPPADGTAALSGLNAVVSLDAGLPLVVLPDGQGGYTASLGGAGDAPAVRISAGGIISVEGSVIPASQIDRITVFTDRTSILSVDGVTRTNAWAGGMVTMDYRGADPYQATVMSGGTLRSYDDGRMSFIPQGGRELALDFSATDVVRMVDPVTGRAFDIPASGFDGDNLHQYASSVQQGIGPTALVSGFVSSMFMDSGLDPERNASFRTILDDVGTSGTLALPNVSNTGDYSEWLNVRAEEACQGALLPSGQAVTIFDLLADPRYLAMQDAALAAPGTVPTLDVLDSLNNAIMGGLDVTGTALLGVVHNIAQQLGIENDFGAVAPGEYGPPVPGARNAGEKLQSFLGTTAAAINTLSSLRNAIEKPTIRSVAAATHQLVSLGVQPDFGMTTVVAEGLGTNVENMGALLSGAGAALSVVAAIENPTPANVAGAANAVTTALNGGQMVPGVAAIASAIGFVENPSVTSGIDTALWIAATINPPVFVPIAIAYSVVRTVVNFVSGGGKPIVLDLDGDGVKLVPVDQSQAFYDFDDNGWREHRGWVDAGDGFLAYDRNGDGAIQGANELSFVGYREGARTDLEGLIAFDTNGDGKISSADADWAQLKVWRDLDGDGNSDTGEVISLEEAGIAEISLVSDGVRTDEGGNIVFGQGTFTRADGTTGIFADVALGTDTRAQPGDGDFGRPLVLNLVGERVHTTGSQDVNVSFDVDADGDVDRTGWITPDEGFLVIDDNRNGTIDDVSEMMGAFADLARLDSNKDGRIDNWDAAWRQLRVWVDKNMDGYSQGNELYTLGQLGIASIDVAAGEANRYDNGNIIRSEGTFTYTDGRQGQIADVAFLNGTGGNAVFAGEYATTFQLSNGQTVQFVTGGQTVEVRRSGVDIVVATGGGNAVSAVYASSVVLMSDGGSDTLMGGSGTGITLVADGGDTLIGGTGETTMISRGAGNTLMGGEGHDVAVFGGSRVDYAITRGALGAATVVGPDGSDTVSEVEVLRFDDGEVYLDGRNNAPVARELVVATNADTALELALLGLLGNDVDVDGDALAVTAVENAMGGTVSLNADGTITFTPMADFNGPAGFDYTVSDGSGGSDTRHVTVTVNHAPVAHDQAVTTVREIAVTEALSVTNIEGGMLAYDVVSGPAYGSLTLAADGSYTYTPEDGFTGTDSFTYRVTDGAGGFDEGTVSVAVGARRVFEGDAEMRVNGASAWQEQPQVTALSDGCVVVVWQSFVPYVGSDVYGQRYSAAGQAVGGEFRINTLTSSDQSRAQVTALSDGGFVVVWQSFVQDGSHYGVYGQRYSAAGPAVGEEFRVNTFTTDNKSSAQVTALSDGGFVITWVSSGQDGSGTGVYGQRYSAAGQAVGGEFRVNTYTTDSQDQPQVTALSDGGFVVVWQSFGQDGSYTGVYGQRYSAAGQAVGGEFRVNTYTTDHQVKPAVTALSNGGFVVTWVSYGQDGSSGSVSGQCYSATGQASGMELRVNTYTSSDQSEAQVTALPDGGFVVVWTSVGQDGSSSGVYGQRYSAAGQAVGGEFRVNTYTTDSQSLPAVTALSDGGFVVVWWSHGQDGSGYGVYSQCYDAVGQAVGGEFRVSTYSGLLWNPQHLPRVQALNGGGYVVVCYGKDGNDNGNGRGVSVRVFAPEWQGGSGDDVIVGDAMDETLWGMDGDDTIDGGSGNDTLVGGVGDDTLVGGAGHDVAVFGGSRVDYAITRGALGAATVVGPDGSDTVSEVEVLRFDDGEVYLDGRNNAPVAQDKSVSTLEDTPLTIVVADLLAGAMDVDGDTLSLAGVGNATGGAVALVDGALVFTPAADFNGIAGFDYIVSDGQGGSDTRHVSVDIVPINDAPVAQDRTVTVLEDMPLAIAAADLLAGATDIDGDALSLAGVGNATGGAVALVDGAVVFTPAANFNGIAGFDYTVSDGNGGSDTRTVTVEVVPVYDPAVAHDQAVTTVREIAVTEALSVTNIEGGMLAYDVVSGPAHGSLTLAADGSYTYTPEDGFTGTDSFTYRVTDGAGGMADGTISVAVGARRLTSDSGEMHSYTGGGQYNVKLAKLADGGFVAVWQSYRPGGSSWGVYGQRYSPAGQAVGEEFQVNTYTPDLQWEPQVTALADGGFVVVWQSNGQDGSGWGVYGQRYSAAGQPAGEEFRVNTYTLFTQYQPQVTALADGGYVVVWQSNGQDGSDTGVYGQRYSAAGQPAGEEFRVNTYTLFSQNQPQVTALSDGGFVAVWGSYNPDGSHCGVYGQRYSAAGQPAGEEFRINTYTLTTREPLVTALSDGGFVVVWTSFSYVQDAGWGVYGQRYSAAGQAVGEEFQVNTYTPDRQEKPQVTALADSGFVVVWQSNGQDGSGSGVYGQRYSAAGQAVGGEFRVHTYTAGNQSLPQVTALADGGFVAAWWSSGQGGVGWGVYGQRYDAAGQAAGEEFRVNTYDATFVPQEPPQILALNGGYVVAWRQDGSGSGGYARVFAPEWQGGSGDDVIVGDAMDETLWGMDGDDTIDGGSGNDTLVGGVGDDTLVGGAGHDVAVFGGSRVDYAITRGALGAATVVGPDGSDTVSEVEVLRFDDGEVYLDGRNNAPVARELVVATNADTALELALLGLLGNDVDVDGDALAVTAVENAMGGTVSLNADGTITFTPMADFNGPAGFDYTVSDGSGSDTRHVTVTVNHAPAAQDKSVSTLEDMPLAIAAADLLAGATDIDGDALSLAGVGNATGGAVALVDGAVVFTPAADFNGIAGFDYIVSDGQGGSDTRHVSVDIVPINDAPVAQDRTVTVLEDTPLAIVVADLLAGAMDVDGDTLSLAGVGNATGGAVALVDGAVVFTPAANFNGIAGFDYTVSDGNGGSDTRTVTVEVVPVYDPAVAHDQAVTTVREIAVTEALSVTNIEGGMLAYDVVSGPAYGSLTLAADGSYTYTPEDGFTGTDSFTYRVTDGAGGMADGTISVAVGARRLYGDSGEMRVNSYTSINQFQPQVTALSDGSFVVIWTSNGQDGSGSGVYGQRYSAAGQAVGGEFRVNTFTTSSQSGQQVTALSDGGFVVVWQSFVQDGSHYGVYGQRYSAAGPAVGGEFRVNTYTTDSQEQPQVTALSDGGFVVTWVSSGQDGSGTGVYGQRYSAAGQAVGGEFRVNTYTTDRQQQPQVTALSDGGFVVTWVSSGQDGSDYGVYGQRYSATGPAVGEEFRVNTFITSQQVVALADGGFVVIWYTRFSDICGQRYGADGQAEGAEFKVNTSSNGRNGPIMCALSTGGFVVTWQSVDGGATGVFARRYGADGEALGDEFRVNTFTTDSQLGQHVTALDDGGFVVTWVSYGQDGSGSGVYAQRYSAQGKAIGGETRINAMTTGNQESQKVFALAGGGYGVTWQSDTDVYLRLVGEAGWLGGSGDDTIVGDDGDDLLIGGGGNDTLIGGDGADIAVFGGNVGGYVVVPGLDGGWTVSGSDGMDVVHDVEVLRFDDAEIYIDGAHAVMVRPALVETSEDVAVTVAAADLLALISDMERRSAVLTGVTGSVGGTAALDENGDVVFIPIPDWNGSAAFDAIISIGTGGIVTQRISIDVRSVNDAPVVFNRAYTGNEDALITLGGAWGTDKDGDTLLTSICGAVTEIEYQITRCSGFRVDNGVVFRLGPALRFLPDANFTGTTTIQFVITDTAGATADGTVTVTVNPINDAPVALDKVVSTLEDTVLTIAAADLLAGAMDVDGDTLSLAGVGNATGGAVALVDGAVVFTPTADFNGIAGFDYTVSDGNGGTDTRHVTVDISPVNDAPVALPKWVVTNENTVLTIAAADLLAGAIDVDGDTLSLESVTNASGGTITMVDDAIVFTPMVDFTGSAGFDYAVSDGHGGTNTQHVSLTVMNLIEGTSASDILIGSAGADTFAVSIGGGFDLIANQGHGPDGDRIQFGMGIARDQLWFKRVADDLLIEILGTGDGVAVDDWFAAADNRVGTIETVTGDRLLGQNVECLVAAMASLSPPSLGQIQLSAAQHDQLDTVLAANWNHG